MRSPVRRRAFALLAAALLLFSVSAGALADAPAPGSISASVNGSTITVSGTWTWLNADKCDNKAVGWAVDWADPADPGNAVKNGVSVGTGADNTVHTNADCGAITSGKNRGGSWSALSHTYASPGTYNVCVVMYDVGLDHGAPKAPDLIAGGGARNKDNSVEGAGAAGGSCTSATIASPASISARKTVNKASADPGDTLTYTIALTNSGGTAGSVDVSDNISTLLAKGTFVSATNGGALSGSTVSWNNINVPAGGSTNLTLSVRLNAGGWSSGTTTLTNAVLVPKTNCAAGTAADCKATTTVSPSANLVVKKTVNKATADPGDTLTYTITIQNTGGADATGVSATDNISTLLAKGTFVSATNGGALSGSTVSWNGLSVNAGATVTLGLSVRLNSSGWTSGSTTFTNTVVVPTSNCASGSSAADCKATTTVSPSANLVVKKTVNKATADPGDTLTYTITIQNTGGADATGVSATDNISTLLAKGTFVSATNGGALSGSTVSWNGLSVNAGATVTLGLSVRLNSSGWTSGSTTFTNTVVVPTSNCASGSSAADCKATTTVAVAPNIVVRKNVDKASADPGATLNYTITVQNTGNGDAPSVDVTDAISALLAHGSFVSASAGGSLSGSTVSWSNLSLDAGTSRTLTFAIKLDTSGWPNGITNIPNTVVVAGSDCASGSSNTACRVSTTVNANATLVVKKSVNATTADPGDTLSYTITVQNTGNAGATNVDVTDDITVLLAHGSFVSASGAGALSGSSVRWSNLSIAAGTTQTLTFSAKLDTSGWPTGSTALPNTVVVAGSDCAAGASNTACRVSTTVTTRATLIVKKSVNATTADPGDTLSYTITVQNTGNASATNVDVTDDISSLLAHGTYVTGSAGSTQSGNSVHWDNQTFAAGTTRTFTFSVKLDAGGWSNGSTSLPNTVVVAGSDCASGAANSACRVTTTVTPRFALAITKGAAGGSTGPWTATFNATSGDSVWYQIKVTNIGNATVTGVTVTDSMGIPAGQCTAVPASLAAGATWTCVYFRTVTEGTTTNTATADSAQTAAVSDVATVIASAAPAPGIRIVKTASPTQLPVGGGNVTYTFVVTNTGNVALANVDVTDDRCVPLTLQSGDTNTNSKLDTGETWRYTCGATLSATATSTATAQGSAGSARVTSSDKVTVTVLVGEPALHLEKTASPTSLPVDGGSVHYTYAVTNVGNAALSNVTVTDDKCSPVAYVSGDSNNNSKLDLTETWRFDCTATLTATTTNHARASGSFGDTIATDADQATVTVASSAPGIRVVKAANPTSLPAGGGSVTYTYVVTNTGNTPLTSVTLRDDKCASVTLQGGDTNSNSRLDLGETWQYRCVQTIASTTTNIAIVSGRAGTVTVTDTAQATVAVTASSAAINVVKTASPVTLPAAGGSVTYTYRVTNKGNVALTNVTLIDDKCSAITSRGGDTNGNSRLDTTETWTYACVQTITQTTTNTALATGFSNGLPVTDTDSALVTVGTPAKHTPRIGMTLTADPVVLPEAGGSVTYTYTIANKGDIALANVTVADDTCATIGAPAGDANGNNLLDLTESWTFTCVATLTRTTTNTATASGQAEGQTVQALDMATVTVTPPAPTATPTEAPTPSPGETTGPVTPTEAPASPGATDATGSPGASGATGGPASPGTSAGPGGSVAGVTSPPKASGAPANSAEVIVNTGSTPSGMVMILILMLGIAAAVLIMTLSKRTSNT